MARRGAKGKGWIRLMRVIIWILAILMILGGVFLGLGVMAATDQAQQTMTQAQNILQQLPNMQVDGATTTVSYAYAISGKVIGIVVMVMMIIAALIMLAETNVFLDMAENVRRIAGRLSRRSMEEE
ncbi:MAG TPA: hypothetical protein IAA71_06620 [Candidatus Pullichristensenella stercoripullorum]|nr:hypothetical protein [Candidatus Pullichristensenella stercoripullorum]